MKYKCACCGYYTLEDLPNDTKEVCPVCFWGEDKDQFKDPELTEGVNLVSLSEARKNFKEFGAYCESVRQYCREPSFKEHIGLEEYGENYN